MDDTLAEKIEEGDYTIELHYDRDPESPRDWENIGTMVCEHRRYTLGDTDGRYDAKQAVRGSNDYKPAWDDADLDDPPTLWELVQKCRDIISMPLYLYDHGGITMSTRKFSCPWDSGQIGFMFCTKEKALLEFGRSFSSRLTQRIRQRAQEAMEQEVKTYDQYLTGDVYRIVVKFDGVELDSCSGFFGVDVAKEAAMEVVNANKEARASSSAEGQETADLAGA